MHARGLSPSVQVSTTIRATVVPAAGGAAALDSGARC
jgi:hypothetical protein